MGPSKSANNVGRTRKGYAMQYIGDVQTDMVKQCRVDPKDSYKRCVRCVEKGWSCSKFDFVAPRNPHKPVVDMRDIPNTPYNSSSNGNQERNGFIGSWFPNLEEQRTTVFGSTTRQQRIEPSSSYPQQMNYSNRVSPPQYQSFDRFQNINDAQQPHAYGFLNPNMGYEQPFSSSIPPASNNFVPMPYFSEQGLGLSRAPNTATPFYQPGAGQLMFTGYVEERDRNDYSDESPPRSRKRGEGTHRNRPQQR